MDNTAQEKPRTRRGDNAKTFDRKPDGKFIAKDGVFKGHKRYRPQRPLDKMTVDELLAKLNANTLDTRTATGAQFEAIKDALEADTSKTVISLLKHDIAVQSILIKSILEYCQDRKGKLIEENGELPKALTKDLPKFQAGMARAIFVLMRLEGKVNGNGVIVPEKPSKGQQDIADIVLGMAQEAE